MISKDALSRLPKYQKDGKNFYSLNDFGRAVGLREKNPASSLDKSFKRKGISCPRIKVHDKVLGRTKDTLCIEVGDAQRDLLRRISTDLRPANCSVPEEASEPVVYLIKDCAANRYKVGYADNLRKRVRSFRTICPDLKVVKVWSAEYEWLEELFKRWIERKVGNFLMHESNTPSEVFCSALTEQEIVDILDELYHLNGFLNDREVA